MGGGRGAAALGARLGGAEWAQIHALCARTLVKLRARVCILANLVPPKPAPIIYCFRAREF